MTFEHLSIDEKSFKKGQQYVSVLSHPDSGCVLDAAEKRDKKACKQRLDKSLTSEPQQRVKKISMDMCQAYMKGCKEKLPHAEVVRDRFHLVKYLNDAMDKVRRREVKTHEGLKQSRYVLLKNQANLTESQRFKFESIRLANYEVSKAWQVRENFKDLFSCHSAEAFILFCRWADDALRRPIKEVAKVAEMFKSHMTGIIEALIHRLSHAMAERLNGKIQEIKLAGRGYRTFDNFRNAILLFHGGLDLYPLKSQ